MKMYGFTLLFLLAQSVTAQISTTQRPTDDTVSLEDDFFAGINKRIGKTVAREMKFTELPGATAVIQAVQRRPTCAVAVGGEFVDYVVARFENTKYWVYWIATARQLPNGRVLALIGWSSPEMRIVALSQSYWRPREAFAEMLPSGEIKSIDLLPSMETALGFKPGSLTKKIFRALHLLHEHGHLNKAIPHDGASLRQSMLNTRKIAEACFPEIVKPLSNITNTAAGQI